MNHIAAVFPGQGSQRAGMARQVLDGNPELVHSYLELADAISGRPISQLCLEGSEDDLRPTDVAQPAILVVSLAILDILKRHGIAPTMAAGHSLGEYSALVAAGALAVEDAIRLVVRRGELMAEADRQRGGAMAAVIGLPCEVVEALCDDVRSTGGGLVECANYNGPDQVVVSGTAPAVRAVEVHARTAGASRVVMLRVSGAFHSTLMSSAADAFAPTLDATPILEPRIPVFANATGQVVRTPDEVRHALLRQLAGPVRWEATIRNMAAAGPDAFIEVGPGRVLTALSGQIAPQIPAFATGDTRRLLGAVDRLAAAAA